MSEKREVKGPAVVVHYSMGCDVPGCGGEMRSQNVTLTSNPPQYPHTCTRCGKRRNFLVCYPTTTYEVADETPIWGDDNG